ncbi:hypothetical protein SprV_0100139200 [Sparganum proliferum]
MQRLLEANRRPTDGAKLYEVKVLKDGLDLDKARRYPRILTSDSEDENELDDIRGNTRGRLGPWPVPPTALRKKVDFLSEKAIWLENNFKDMKGMLADTRRALQTVNFVSKEKPPVIQLPLRTSEDYDDFVSKVGMDREIFDETIKHLSTVGGRTEKEFIRNLLTSLMGPPLCQTFYAIRNNSQYRGSHPEIIRQTTIEWFHGTRDRYGGRAKRRRTADMGTLEGSLSSQEYSVSISEDTEPAVDNNYRQQNTGF